jgi:hypothetical protein
MSFIRKLFLMEKRCPACESTSIRRSARRNTWESVIGVLILPFRCEDCYVRFYRMRSVANGAPERALSETR